MDKKIRMHQFLSGFTYGDAISDYAIEVQNILIRRGIESIIYSEYMDAHVKGKCMKYAYYLDNREENDIAILHYSIGSAIVPFVYEEAPRIVLIYHNITPYYYFADVNPYLYKECLAGRKWLGHFKDKAEIALADSEFNRKELEALGFKKTKVLPIKIDFSKFDKEFSKLLSGRFKDGKKNILFLGRLIPNKRVEDVIKLYSVYKRYYNENSRLFIVGNYKGYERYYFSLIKLIEVLKLSDVVFTGHISRSFLSALLCIADVFVMLSEHEGFCVPLLEAMYRRVPVVGYESGAIPYTMRGGGILVKEKNFYYLAGLLSEIIEDGELRREVVEAQEKVLDVYMNYNFEKEFFSCIEGII
jgi:glycosyltransferase involved in cell wall biosynthesis